jgi:protein-L-isoaspartate(D-aspartate) O-methyltransferase
MMASIRAGFTRTVAWTGLARPVREVEEVMGSVPRDRFVPPDPRPHAFEDRALSIGYGATISQPFIVALMTSIARLRPEHRVLEVGTGSGYQSAILGKLASEVFTLEIVPELRERSAAVLAELGHANVHVLDGDGWRGLAAHAPFDVILVTACATGVPEALRDELACGGRMVLPIESGAHQQLIMVEKDESGATTQQVVLPVSFVPMVGRGS